MVERNTGKAGAVVVAVLVLATAGYGQIQIWQGPGEEPGNNWNNTANWNGGVVPGVGGNTEQVGITTAKGGGPFTGTIVVDVDVPTAGQYKSQVAQQDYTLDLQGHTLTIAGGEIGRDMGSNWSTWDLVVTDTTNGAGTFGCTGNPFLLRQNRDDDAEVEEATWTFASNVNAVFGQFNPATSINGSTVHPAMATAVLKDSVVLTADDIVLGDNTQLGTTGDGMTGVLHIKDQASVSVDHVLQIGGKNGGLGTGVVRITGKDASLAVPGPGLIIANGSMVFDIDDLAGPTPVNLSVKLRIDGPAEIDIDLDGVTPAQDQVYTLITYGKWDNNVVGDGLSLAAEDVGTWELINTGGVEDQPGQIQAKYLLASVILGDVNGDGVVDGLDIQPFVDLLTGGGYQAEADINEDSVVDGLDIQPFVDIITGAGGNPVPEPATLGLMAAGGLALLRRRRR